jgi:hypothetical protein
MLHQVRADRKQVDTLIGRIEQLETTVGELENVHAGLPGARH